MKVLIADDDRVCRMVLRRLLERVSAVEVTEAEDGQAALDLLKGGYWPDLCILDVLMPRLTGLEFLERVRGDAALRSLRVVICTAFSDRENVIRAAKAHVDAYVTKPYEAEILLRELHIPGETIARQDGIEDPRVVCKRLGIDRPLLATMQTEFFNHLSATHTRIEEAIQVRDFSSAAMISNGIKGACTTLGLTKLGNAFGQFESALKDSGDSNRFESLLRTVVEQGAADREQLNQPVSKLAVAA